LIVVSSVLIAILQTISPSLNLEIVRSDVIGALLELSKDPIPNIRFNVAKALEVMASSFGDSPEGRIFVQDWIAPTLERQQNDQDADVRYFANRALQKTVVLVS
jgi:serine/threonine-protein phosphatase 2A regulatory subunit A